MSARSQWWRQRDADTETAEVGLAIDAHDGDVILVVTHDGHETAIVLTPDDADRYADRLRLAAVQARGQV